MGSTALVIGSQTGGLTGPHADVEIVADALAAHGFDVRRHIESAATSRAILDAYEDLIADAAAATPWSCTTRGTAAGRRT